MGALGLALVLLLASSPAFAQVKAFPQAEGFGATSQGGRGGDVYHVTNLNDSGSGSLRYGIQNAPSGGRTIVFDVGGWIHLNSELGVTRDKITIAGQTAPGGIGVRNAEFSIGGDDIVVRHMRFRPGKGAGRVDAAGANNQSNRVIYDHISAGFSYDESLPVAGTNYTLQYSSVSFGMEDHSAGSLIQDNGGAAGNLTFHHNVYAHNETRNPKARANLVDWLDNVVYDYHNGFIAGQSENSVSPHWRANFDGNTYISDGRPMMTGGRDFNFDLYYAENALDRDGDSSDDPITYSRAEAMADQSIVSSAYNWYTTPFDAPDVWQSGSPASAYTRTLAEFGATPWARDEVDQLVHDNIVNRTGSRVSHENQLPVSNNGYPTLGGLPTPTDSDQDGIPNDWEEKHGTDPNQASNNNDFDLDGYTDLEEYLNDLAAFAAVGPVEFSGVGRYADSKRWTNRWEPSRVDDVGVNDGAAFIDAVGQKAGTLRVGDRSDAKLYVTSGWLEVTDDLVVGGTATGRVRQYGGELRVLDGAVTIENGKYELHGGTLSTPLLVVEDDGQFLFTGGTLSADQINADLQIAGGTLHTADGGASTTTIQGDLNIMSGGLAIDLAGIGLSDSYGVSGAVELGGHLEVELVGGFEITGSASWEILSAVSLVGDFDSITPGFSTETIGNSLWLVANGSAASGVNVPEPATVWIVALALIAVPVVRRCRMFGVAIVLVAACASLSNASAAVITAGDLVVDLRARDLDSAATTWTNLATSGASVGNFGTVGGGSLNVASAAGVPKALYVPLDIGDAVISQSQTPSSIEGNNTRSVEAWVYLSSTSGSATAVSWGESGNDQLSSFRYTSQSNGMFSGWNNDGGWSSGSVNTGSWKHLAWTYDGDLVRGYIDGRLNSTFDTVDANSSGSDLDTTHRLITVGGARDGVTDPWSGYIADVRVHTGVLTTGEVLNNFQQGIYVGATDVQGDYNNDGVVSLADYAVWRNSLGGTTLANEEVSPGIVDIADYFFWVERVGATTPEISSALSAAQRVPEPTAVCTALLGCIAGLFYRR
ncbi:LamG-like jellyroll fold domain-containing protein [Aeoliella sp.]|uniref:LamG-like jellyroll fold domain-containing protein n=1 Tax=Aeoliella sp. TaxID=2795800 RepID=UPI003CCB872C